MKAEDIKKAEEIKKAEIKNGANKNGANKKANKKVNKNGVVYNVYNRQMKSTIDGLIEAGKLRRASIEVANLLEHNIFRPKITSDLIRRYDILDLQANELDQVLQLTREQKATDRRNALQACQLESEIIEDYTSIDSGRNFRIDIFKNINPREAKDALKKQVYYFLKEKYYQLEVYGGDGMGVNKKGSLERWIIKTFKIDNTRQTEGNNKGKLLPDNQTVFKSRYCALNVLRNAGAVLLGFRDGEVEEARKKREEKAAQKVREDADNAKIEAERTAERSGRSPVAVMLAKVEKGRERITADEAFDAINILYPEIIEPLMVDTLIKNLSEYRDRLVSSSSEKADDEPENLPKIFGKEKQYCYTAKNAYIDLDTFENIRKTVSVDLPDELILSIESMRVSEIVWCHKGTPDEFSFMRIR